MKLFRKYILFLIIAFLIEILIFNPLCFINLFHKAESLRDLNGSIQSDYSSARVSLYDSNINIETIYLDITAFQENGEQSPVDVSVVLTDEGNSIPYTLSTKRIFPGIKKEKYLNIHPYGNVHSLEITVTSQYPAYVQINDIVINPRTPLFFSLPRFLFAFILIALTDLFAVKSPVWERKWSKKGIIISTAVVLLVNICVFFVLARMGKAFLHPVWDYHFQYQKLARAISQGVLYINDDYTDIISALESISNPYDTALRSSIADIYNCWDIAYYDGHFYVYFGVVPVFLYYLPCYLIFHRDFPTWFGVFISASMALSGSFYLFHVIKRKFFPDLSHFKYLILSTILGNSLNLFVCMLHADFYYLPIVTSLALVLWGLGLIMSATYFNKEKPFIRGLQYTAGSLLIALTAGCRPQFLIALFLMLIILFTTSSFKEYKKYLPAIIVPMAIVAALLMAYNYARFNSPFDFGANYNLTTNDMRYRGFNLGRGLEGLYYYFIQPINSSVIYPFAQFTIHFSEYFGLQISDWTYGGVFFLYPVLLSIPAMILVRKDLIGKNLMPASIACLVLSIVVVVADTEMAGVLTRYYIDYLWLLAIPAFVTLAQLMLSAKNKQIIQLLYFFILFAGVFGLFYEFLVAIKGSGMLDDNPAVYYALRSFML